MVQCLYQIETMIMIDTLHPQLMSSLSPFRKKTATALASSLVLGSTICTVFAASSSPLFSPFYSELELHGIPHIFSSFGQKR